LQAERLSHTYIHYIGVC